MRIAYNREKRYSEALLHGLQQQLWTCIEAVERDRFLPNMQSPEHWRADIEKLLKRAKQPELLDAVLERLAPFFAEPRRDAVASTLHSVQELLHTDHT